MKPLSEVDTRRFPQGAVVTDTVAVEEPLEIRVDGAPLAVLMRTPGQDRALVSGFLFSEGVIDGDDDLRGIGPCTDPNTPNGDNVYLVRLAEGCEQAETRIAKAQRTFLTGSSCGLCGKASIDAILQTVPSYESPIALDHAFLKTIGQQAAAGQTLFEATGGLHGAALFGPDRRVLAQAEDVGRHNAVDKVIGLALAKGVLGADEQTLWVSGRASFELVQKALVARFRAMVCVGAPTSLAVALARDSRLTLVGFARGEGRYNIY